MAIASGGTYPTPGVTLIQRAAFAASFGLLSFLPLPPDVDTSTIVRLIRVILIPVELIETLLIKVFRPS